jgi:hypothetical protein
VGTTRCWASVLGLALLSVGSASAAVPGASPARDVEQTLFLIGDAGNPAPGGEPVLRALARDIARDPSRAFVVFLGDNIYPRGLPPADAAGRPEMERRIDAQVDAVKAAGARAIFIPGNHDWGPAGPEGWAAVRRQAERVDRQGAPGVSFLPKDGCPGPASVEVGPWLRLVALDTEWWLRDSAKPMHPDSPCLEDSPEEVVASLDVALAAEASRHVVVVGHHPLATGGPHGGHFSFRQHVFPLTDKGRALWIPLPIVGSIYPLARQAGVSNQDLNGPANRRMREALERAFRARPPLAYAAGHEHALQVLRGTSARHLLVSGAGFAGHTSPVASLEATRYASSRGGFMRLDVASDGRVRLAVVEVDGAGTASEAFGAWLDE